MAHVISTTLIQEGVRVSEVTNRDYSVSIRNQVALDVALQRGSRFIFDPEDAIKVGEALIEHAKSVLDKPTPPRITHLIPKGSRRQTLCCGEKLAYLPQHDYYTKVEKLVDCKGQTNASN
jgi:hypothetical protein